MTNWGGAYHWATDSPISALKAIQHRESGRLEAGDCWCCKNCYTAKPRKGIQIFPRKHKSTPHFWVGSGASYTLNQCDGYRTQMAIGESYRYTQFYRDLKNWLVSEEAKLALCFSDFEEDKSRKYSDFLLNLTKPIKGYTNLSILIIHKNRMRQPQHSLAIVIDLSHWTLEQLNDFEFGKRKIIEEFGQLLTPAEIVPESSEVVVYGEEWENSLISMLGNNENSRSAIIDINIAIRRIEEIRRVSRGMREAEEILSKDETLWQPLDFEGLSNYFAKHIKKFFPSTCSRGTSSFHDIVTRCNDNYFQSTRRIRFRGVHLTDENPMFINLIEQKYDVKFRWAKKYRKSGRYGTSFELESREDLTLPYLTSFIDNAKLQWDIVENKSKYYLHRSSFHDDEEVDDLQKEKQNCIEKYPEGIRSNDMNYYLYELNQRITAAARATVKINRFVYYLFFNEHRESNRWSDR